MPTRSNDDTPAGPSQNSARSAPAVDAAALDQLLREIQTLLGQKREAIEAELKTHGLDSPDAIHDHAMALEATEAAGMHTPPRTTHSAVHRRQRI